MPGPVGQRLLPGVHRSSAWQCWLLRMAQRRHAAAERPCSSRFSGSWMATLVAIRSDTSGLHSQGLAAIANVSGHELAEALTDPASPGAWYDSSGAENGDKCAWTFGAPLVTFTNGTQWKIQGEWSNKAYTAGTGYANSSGQKGCLSGK